MLDCFYKITVDLTLSRVLAIEIFTGLREDQQKTENLYKDWL